jgi:hypothetical protein
MTQVTRILKRKREFELFMRIVRARHSMVLPTINEEPE